MSRQLVVGVSSFDHVLKLLSFHRVERDRFFCNVLGNTVLFALPNTSAIVGVVELMCLEDGPAWAAASAGGCELNDKFILAAVSR